jgi:hypothetical protein
MKIDYFSHDTKARSDSKLVSLAMRQGMEGLGVYWCIVEMLYENEGRIMRTECERIAYELRTHSDCVNSVIYGHELFQWDDLYFWSNSVLNRLKTITEKSDKARQSASKRWENANAMRTQCEGNAIKEKESKVNKTILGLPEPKSVKRFVPPTAQEVKAYMQEQGMDDLSEKWLAFYESKGWQIGRNKMKDWKAAVRTWKSNYKDKGPQTTVKPVKASLNDE